MEKKIVKERVQVVEPVWEERDVEKFVVTHKGRYGNFDIKLDNEEAANIVQQLADKIKSFNFSVGSYDKFEVSHTVIPKSAMRLVNDTEVVIPSSALNVVTAYCCGSKAALIDWANDRITIAFGEDMEYAEPTLGELKEIIQKVEENIKSCGE